MHYSDFCKEQLELLEKNDPLLFQYYLQRLQRDYLLSDDVASQTTESDSATAQKLEEYIVGVQEAFKAKMRQTNESQDQDEKISEKELNKYLHDLFNTRTTNESEIEEQKLLPAFNDSKCATHTVRKLLQLTNSCAKNNSALANLIPKHTVDALLSKLMTVTLKQTVDALLNDLKAQPDISALHHYVTTHSTLQPTAQISTQKSTQKPTSSDLKLLRQWNAWKDYKESPHYQLISHVITFLNILTESQRNDTLKNAWPRILDTLLTESDDIKPPTSGLVYIIISSMITLVPELQKWLETLSGVLRLDLFKELADAISSSPRDSQSDFAKIIRQKAATFTLQHQAFNHFVFTEAVEIENVDLRGIDLSNIELKNITFKHCVLSLSSLENRGLSSEQWVALLTNDNVVDATNIPDPIFRERLPLLLKKAKESKIANLLSALCLKIKSGDISFLFTLENVTHLIQLANSENRPGNISYIFQSWLEQNNVLLHLPEFVDALTKNMSMSFEKLCHALFFRYEKIPVDVILYHYPTLRSVLNNAVMLGAEQVILLSASSRLRGDNAAEIRNYQAILKTYYYPHLNQWTKVFVDSLLQGESSVNQGDNLILGATVLEAYSRKAKLACNDSSRPLRFLLTPNASSEVLEDYVKSADQDEEIYALVTHKNLTKELAKQLSEKSNCHSISQAVLIERGLLEVDITQISRDDHEAVERRIIQKILRQSEEPSHEAVKRSIIQKLLRQLEESSQDSQTTISAICGLIKKILSVELLISLCSDSRCLQHPRILQNISEQIGRIYAPDTKAAQFYTLYTLLIRVIDGNQLSPNDKIVILLPLLDIYASAFSPYLAFIIRVVEKFLSLPPDHQNIAFSHIEHYTLLLRAHAVIVQRDLHLASTLLNKLIDHPRLSFEQMNALLQLLWRNHIRFGALPSDEVFTKIIDQVNVNFDNADNVLTILNEIAKQVSDGGIPRTITQRFLTRLLQIAQEKGQSISSKNQVLENILSNIFNYHDSRWSERLQCPPKEFTMVLWSVFETKDILLQLQNIKNIFSSTIKQKRIEQVVHGMFGDERAPYDDVVFSLKKVDLLMTLENYAADRRSPSSVFFTLTGPHNDGTLARLRTSIIDAQNDNQLRELVEQHRVLDFYKPCHDVLFRGKRL